MEVKNEKLINMRNNLTSLESANAAIKVPLIDAYKELKITLVYDNIVVRNINESGVSFEVKNLFEISPEDEILIIKRPNNINNNILTLSFIPFEKYGKYITEVDQEYLNEYFEFVYKYIVENYNTDKFSYVTVLENPNYTIAPNFEKLDFNNKIEVFSKYLNSYLPEMNRYLSSVFSGSAKATVENIYGKEFQKEILGKYKIPIWTQAAHDEFASIKIKIEEKLQQNMNKAGDLPGDTNQNKYLDYYNRNTISSAYCRIPFVTQRNVLKNSAVWKCVGPGLFKLNNINKISDLVNLIEDENDLGVE